MEIYSTRDCVGSNVSVHKKGIAPGVKTYFIDVNTRFGEQFRCELSANSALNLGRALLWSLYDDAIEARAV